MLVLRWQCGGYRARGGDVDLSLCHGLGAVALLDRGFPGCGETACCSVATVWSVFMARGHDLAWWVWRIWSVVVDGGRRRAGSGARLDRRWHMPAALCPLLCRMSMPSVRDWLSSNP